MIRISNSFLINGLREIGSLLITRIKHTTSVLAHIGSVSNTGTDYYQTPKSFYKRDPSQTLAPDIPLKTSRTEKSLMPTSTINLAAKIEPIKDGLQLRPPIAPAMIIQLEQLIEKDRQSTNWFTGYNSPNIVLKPTRRAPLPPLSEPMIEKLVQMIESDKQSAKNTRTADSKLTIKDNQFDTQIHQRK